MSTPLITHDAVVLGLLAATLGLVFWTASGPTPFWKRFYAVVPALLLCYFLPALYNTLGLIDGKASGLYPMARDYLLPSALVLLTLSVDLPATLRLGPKALIMFATGTLSVMLGAVVAFALLKGLSPGVVEGDVWRGLTTVAGSWIGGGANQAAMREVFGVDADVFGQFVAVDILVSSLWLALILYLAPRAAAVDRWTGADTSAIDDLRRRIETYQAEHVRVPSLADLMVILGLGLGATGLAHALADPIIALVRAAPEHWHLEQYSLAARFFWVVVLATAFGIALSFTRARSYEGAGASKVGTVMLYVLIACIGMGMDLMALRDVPGLFVLGAVWLLFHGVVMFAVAKLIRAPLFFLAIGSEANIGGAASAPAVASVFHPALAPVGVLLAVLGYGVGTYGAWLTGLMLQALAG